MEKLVKKKDDSNKERRKILPDVSYPFTEWRIS